jgi:exopolyphosphatase/guanosine-5'-triphosphate,3'-diphosphate pyrophosphatase
MIACDLGSNTFRVVQIDCNTKERINEFEKIVKTADGLHKNKVINDKALKRVIQAIKEAKSIIDFKNDTVYGIATAAMRLAKNSKEVLEKIKKETGLKIVIIDGNEEARLTSIAVENALKRKEIKFRSYMLLDLGGGSTELFFKAGKNIASKSFNIGIVTIAQKYKNFDLIKDNLEDELSGLKEFVEDLYAKYFKPAIFVATAGTPTTIAAFEQGMDYGSYDYKKINGTKLYRKNLKNSMQRLLAMDEKNREFWVGAGRGDLIIAGVLLLDKIVDICGFNDITVIDDGLREGLALSKCN